MSHTHTIHHTNCSRFEIFRPGTHSRRRDKPILSDKGSSSSPQQAGGTKKWNGHLVPVVPVILILFFPQYNFYKCPQARGAAFMHHASCIVCLSAKASKRSARAPRTKENSSTCTEFTYNKAFNMISQVSSESATNVILYSYVTASCCKGTTAAVVQQQYQHCRINKTVSPLLEVFPMIPVRDAFWSM